MSDLIVRQKVAVEAMGRPNSILGREKSGEHGDKQHALWDIFATFPTLLTEIHHMRLYLIRHAETVSVSKLSG